MFVPTLLPSNPQICLDPNRKTELDTIVSSGFQTVLVGTVDCQTHLEGGNIFQEVAKESLAFSLRLNNIVCGQKLRTSSSMPWENVVVQVTTLQ